MKRRDSKTRALPVDAPLKHLDHKRPVSRRDFIRQGFGAGSAMVFASTLFSLFGNPRAAQASLSADLDLLKQSCVLAVPGAGKIPFICFDLAGGASTAGSNVLTGGRDGQFDFLSTAGYSKLGLPGDQIPPIANAQTATNDFINTDLGLAFHSDSGYLRGILEKAALSTTTATNGAVIPARSLGDGHVDFVSIFSKLAQYDFDGWAVVEWECCIKHPEQGAQEGALFIEDHIIRVTEKAFDDFADAGTDEVTNKKILGI